MSKRHYFLITDVENSKDYLIWRDSFYDIMGSVEWFAKKQNTTMDKLRVYPFETKAQWNGYGNKNLYRIAYWQSTTK